jgi:hypothetical protein
MVAGAGVASADEPGGTCVANAGGSGFSAAMVAHAGQTISRRTVNATGCDVGIYVDAPHVTISRVKVMGANDAGILVFDTHDVTVTRSDVSWNGFNSPAEGPHSGPQVNGTLPQAFAISLFGVSDSIVTRNNVHDNGRGGIGIMDDGPSGPGRVVGGEGIPSTAVPVSNVLVSRNVLWANYGGCAIVTSAFNAGNTVSNVTIDRNTVIGTGFTMGTEAMGNEAGEQIADVGGIVAQSNGNFSTVSDITISRNTVTNSVEAGVIVHAAAPGSHTAGVTVTHNKLSGNNMGAGETLQTTGVVVSVIGPPPGPICPPGSTDTTIPPCYFNNPGETNDNTVVSHNQISGQYYGVWTQGSSAPTMMRNHIKVTDGGTAYFQASAPTP